MRAGDSNPRSRPQVERARRSASRTRLGPRWWQRHDHLVVSSAPGETADLRDIWFAGRSPDKHSGRECNSSEPLAAQGDCTVVTPPPGVTGTCTPSPGEYGLEMPPCSRRWQRRSTSGFAQTLDLLMPGRRNSCGRDARLWRPHSATRDAASRFVKATLRRNRGMLF